MTTPTHVSPTTHQVFADNAAAYALAGWPCVIPVPADKKHPPPTGFTGAEGRDTDAAQLVAWAGTHPAHSIALRLPAYDHWCVIGIDVDEYEKGGVRKHGAQTLAAAVERWGDLPPTWSSTARGPGQPSRILLFRAPAGRYAANLNAVGPDVEVIQRHHRYVVVAPSPHSIAGTPYAWYRPDGSPAAPGEVPQPSALAELPAAWVAGLAEGATEQGPAAAGHHAGHGLLGQLLADNRIECAEITSVRFTALDELTAAEAGSRHDTLSKRVYQLVQLAASGHTGASYAIEELRLAWAGVTAGEDRGREYHDMLTTAARKAVTLVGEHQVPRDPCLLMDGFEVPAPAPTDDANGELIEVIEPARWFFPREVIGTHTFDPKGNLDQPLAQSVLERTYPLLRYAYDTRGWLLRVPDRWELHGDLTNRAVTLVAGMLPLGDPTAEKGSDEHERSARRARFNSNNGRSAIAKTMSALVEGGMHPCTVQITDLDADPEVLWAGGLPWNLRACRADVPMESWLARIDPATPHLQTAPVMPELRPTPLWDAFLAAVWPDPEIRDWALRVLSIALTGYADKALPIMVGEKDRGKTQVVSLLMSVLGSYAHAADPRLLGSEGAKAHQSIVFALKGRRLSFIDEGPREGKFATERLKQLTGGGELTANQMNQNPITFSPTHTLILTTNDLPVLTDPAIRTRARLVPCGGDVELVRVARAAIGHTTSSAWRAEASGVLAKMMIEAGAWLADPTTGLTEGAPESIRYLAENEAAEQDPIRSWVDDETEPWEAGTPSRELYSAFVTSCLQANTRRDSIPSETSWGRALTRLGYPSISGKRSKKRQLRIRRGGPWADGPGDGFGSEGVGLVSGSEANPTPTFSQVSPAFPSQGVGFVGFPGGLTYMRTPAHAHEAAVPSDPEPVTAQPSIPGLTCENTPVTGSSADPTADLPAIPDAPAPGVTVFDLETGSADELCTYGPAGQDSGYVRLGGYTHDGEIRLSAETDRLARYLERAAEGGGTLAGHNILGFDLLALARYHGLDFHAMVERGAVFDTLLAARQIDPPRARSNQRYDLDRLAERMGLAGKAHDLKKLAKEFGGYDRIPLDDPRYREYLYRDVLVSLGVYAKTAVQDPYLIREHRVAALAGQITLNGFAIDRDLLDVRLAEVAGIKAAALAELEQAYGIPMTSEKGVAYKSPLATTAGKEALERALLALGAAELPRTAKTGALMTGGDEMAALARRYPQAARLCELVSTVTGARTIYGTIDTHTHLTDRGWRVHPTISMEQSTGRASTTKPGLTVIGKKGERYHERDVLVADPGEVMLSVDLAQVDARAVAALSGDPAYRAMFEPGRDLHAEVAQRVWGEPSRREHAKAIGHGWNYGMGLAKLAAQAEADITVAQQFDAAMRYQFPRLVQWRDEVRATAAAGLLLDNGFGRKMNPDPERAHTQGPAFMGQGAARDLMMEGLLRLPREVYPMLRAIVHDEVVLSVPVDIARDVAPVVTNAMSFEWRGVPIIAEPQKTRDGTVRFGRTWGDLYAKEAA
ncbi:DNA polymerase [Nocardioides sp. LHD-245]|uniref:DNA polymerase n=1 Tax=Nocardioides sp. LHD-245 TaxID=3051387 RepID=UPI0027E0937C|nr:DNA polymerase [Nocardioides sp. LHD-245]